MKKSNFMPSVVLGCICLAVALLLSLVNMFTAPVIEAAQNAAANAALLEVLPEGKNFEEIEITPDYPSVVTAGYKADGGYVFRMSVVGYKPGLVIMCGIDSDGRIVGVKHIQSSETYGMEPELNGVYIGDTLDSAELILATGATSSSKTSKAYFDAIKAALQAAIIASGGSVDVRTPEQILQDNCNAALGTEGKTFTKWFATEALVGVDAVYETEGGRVFVIGEAFIGVNASGEITTANVSADDSAAVNAANTAVAESTLTEITALPDGVSSNVQKVYTTESGNYVFEVKASGYKHATNMEFAGIDDGYFFIKVSVSSDGKIIDVLTTSHSESSGFGDACATEDYYEQYRGKESADVILSVTSPDFHSDQIADGTTGVGIIASSTFTTYGYQKAVKNAFDAFELLTTNEGGNE